MERSWRIGSAIVALIAVLILELSAAPPASGGAPTEQIRAHVEKVYRLGGTGDRRSEVRKVIDEMFDWTEMARQSLGQQWGRRTPTERAEFVRLFADLFEHAYLSKIQLTDADKFKYLDETIEDNSAVVRTKVITRQGGEIAVDYKARREGSTGWKVYDLDIEGVSLVTNYRSQFNSIIARSAYEGLVQRLKMAEEKRLRQSGF